VAGVRKGRERELRRETKFPLPLPLLRPATQAINILFYYAIKENNNNKNNNNNNNKCLSSTSILEVQKRLTRAIK